MDYNPSDYDPEVDDPIIDGYIQELVRDNGDERPTANERQWYFSGYFCGCEIGYGHGKQDVHERLLAANKTIEELEAKLLTDVQAAHLNGQSLGIALGQAIGAEQAEKIGQGAQSLAIRALKEGCEALTKRNNELLAQADKDEDLIIRLNSRINELEQREKRFSGLGIEVDYGK